MTCRGKHIGLLASRAIDALGDFLADGVFFFLLAENFRVSDGIAGLVVGTARGISVLVIGLGANVIERVPRRGPLGLLAATKIGCVLGLALMWMGAARTDTPERIWLFTLAYWVLYAPNEALGEPAYLYAIKRLNRITTPVRDALFGLDYGICNLSAFTAFLLVTLWRWSASGDDALANLGVLGTSTGLYVLAGLSALLVHHELTTGDEPALERSREVDDPLTDLLPSCRPCSEESKTVEDPDASSRFRTYVLAWVLLIGARVFMIWLNALLPKYIARRTGDHTFFPLLLAINPALIFLWSLILPRVIKYGRHLHWICTGLIVQALSVAWSFAGEPGDRWPLILLIVQSTIGEALAWTRIEAWLMSMGGAREQPHFRAAVAVPGAVLSIGAIMASGAMFDAYCPMDSTPGQCSPWIWAWVLGVGSTTPLGLGVMGLGLGRL